MQTLPKEFLLSLVVPVLNEAEAIPLFLRRTQTALEGIPHEVIFIDDGSTDATPVLLAEATRTNPHVGVVTLARNFGKEAALCAGLAAAQGTVVVPLDVDLQDPPELIPTMLQQWQQGSQMVVAVRTERASDGTFKRVTAAWFYRLFNRLSGNVQLVKNGGDFRLLDRAVVNALLSLPERTRFLKGLYAWVGFTTTTVGYERPPRAAGHTKWNTRKLLNYALEGIFSFSTLPLRVWSYLGLIIATCAFVYGLHVVVQVLLFGRVVPGYASLIVAVSFMGGIQLIGIGLLGEYLGRTYLESKQRPLYIVARQSLSILKSKTQARPKAKVKGQTKAAA